MSNNGEGRGRVPGTLAAAALLTLLTPPVPGAHASSEEDAPGDIALSVEQHELEIAPHRVHARYVLRNAAATEVTTTVTLPVETFVAENDDDAEALSSWERAAVVVDGVPRRVELRIRREDNTVRISYRWKQTVPAGGQLTVEHEYDPGGQLLLPRGGEDTSADWQQLAADYCLDKSTQRWAQAAQRRGQRVHFLLATGVGRGGSIGRFKLTVKKTKPTQRLSVCLPGLRRVDGTTLQLERRLYTPQGDLKLLFFD